jgi:hypothetical protein
MPNTIRAGTIFIREGAELPQAARVESEPYIAGWRLVKNLDGYGLDRKIHEAGWNFFCHAGKVKAITLGRDEQEMARRAVKRILGKVNLETFNSLEITEVVTQRFQGVPYVSVSARPRHIQEGVFLFRAKDLPVTEPTRLAA